MEFRDYWYIVLRHWRLLVACVVIGMVAAGVLTAGATATYTSSARVFVSTSPKNPASDLKGAQLVAQQLGSYANLASGSKLARQVSDALGGTPGPAVLQHEVTAEAIPATAVIVLRATDTNAARARDITQAYATGLSKLVEDLQSDNGGGIAVIRAEVVDAASLPTTPSVSSPLVNLVAGLVVGLAIGLGLTVLRELMDDTVTEPTDVARIADAPVLGTIPKDLSSSGQPAGVGLVGSSAWAEGFRVLRTNLQYADLDEPVDGTGRVLVITGPRKGDGATTVASNLAASLAATQQRVALVECDLRYPSLAERLGLDPAVGLTTVLGGKVTANEALQPAGDSGLVLLPAGPLPPNPSDLLASPAMEGLLASLRREYDVVILDAPPVLPVADAAGLAAQADGALLVTRQGKTKEPELGESADRLAAVGARLLGVVVNLAKVDRSVRDYGNGSRRRAGATT